MKNTIVLILILRDASNFSILCYFSKYLCNKYGYLKMLSTFDFVSYTLFFYVIVVVPVILLQDDLLSTRSEVLIAINNHYS